jgi:insulysin
MTDQEFQKEKWYGTEFVKQKFSEELIQKMRNPNVEMKDGLKLGHPNENSLFPNNLDVLEKNEELSKSVKLIHSDDHSDVWYKKSDKFKTPKTVVSSFFYTNDCGFNLNVEGRVFVDIWLKVLNDYFREFAYMAEMASLEFSRSQIDGYLSFDFRGYSDTIGDFIEKCFEKLASFEASKFEVSFLTQKEELMKNFENFPKLQPYMQLTSIAKNVIMTGEYSMKEKLAYVKDLNFERFLDLSSKFLKNARTVWFFNGNLKPDHAMNITSKVVETLGFKAIPKAHILNTRLISLEENTETTLIVDAGNPEEKNSGLLSIFQDRNIPKDKHEYMIHDLYHSVVFQILDQPAFDFLRTKEQLGYIAYSRILNFRDIIGGGFIIQTSEKSPEFAMAKTYEFLNMYKEKLENLTDEMFETAVNAVIMEKKEIDVSLVHESVRLSRQIVRHTYEFDLREQQIAHLEKMKDKTDVDSYQKAKQRVTDHFLNLFYKSTTSTGVENGPKILNIELVSSDHKEENEKIYEENKDILQVPRTKISEEDITDFKNSSMLLPDRYLTRFSKLAKL